MDYISYLFGPKKENEPNTIDFDEETIDNTFCSKCLKFPEYSIRFTSVSTFSLVHSCLEGKIVEKPLQSDYKYEHLQFKCHYCEKKCENICIKCKYILCEECFAEHNRVTILENIKISPDEISDKNTSMNLIDSQYFCEQHFLKYNYCCPVCKINLCDSCIESHIHINCLNILAPNMKDSNTIEPSNDCFKRLYHLAQIFHSCYNKSFSNSIMTMNILLNNMLANNIIEFIGQNQAPSKGSEIKNNYFNNIDKNSYLCKEYDDSEFNDYYRNLILSACGGNIIDYFKLNEIGIVYKASKLPRFFNWNSYHNLLELRISNFIHIMKSIIKDFDSDEIYLNLSKCFRKISTLKLKNELNTFSFELLKTSALKINYKLDFELRRKVGNILGKLILQKFSDNLNTIKPTKYLLTLSSEKIAEYISSPKNIKQKNKSSDIKSNGQDNSPESKFVKALNMLIDKANEEKVNVDYENAKDSNVIITFKSLENKEDEWNKAIILNLFFYIKKTFGDNFNYQIHNASHSVNAAIAETLKKFETKEEKKNSEIENKDKKDIIHISNIKLEKNGTQSNDSEIEANKKKININDINMCSDISRITSKLDKKIEINEKFLFQKNYNILAGDDDSIIKSSVDDFAKTLEKIKSNFSPSANITLQQSLDLYLEGKKGKILEKTFSISNLKAITKECVNNASKNKELEEVKEFCQKFGHKLDNDLEFLYSCLKIIITNLGEVNHIFDNQDVQKLLNKYKITQPVDLIKAFNNLTTSLYKNNHLEEIYYLIYVISYYLVSSIIKALIKIKNEFDKLPLDKVIENNIIKEELISKFMKEVNIPGENILNQDIWKQIQRCKNFIKDEKMDEMDKKIINYVKTKSIDDYKKDLISLLQPYVKKINLDGLDPQNIYLDSFMEQNGLSC